MCAHPKSTEPVPWGTAGPEAKQSCQNVRRFRRQGWSFHRHNIPHSRNPGNVIDLMEALKASVEKNTVFTRSFPEIHFPLSFLLSSPMLSSAYRQHWRTRALKEILFSSDTLLSSLKSDSVNRIVRGVFALANCFSTIKIITHPLDIEIITAIGYIRYNRIRLLSGYIKGGLYMDNLLSEEISAAIHKVVPQMGYPAFGLRCRRHWMDAVAKSRDW